MARPRGGEWLQDEMAAMRREGVGVLVCLLEYGEMLELELEREREMCEAAGMAWIHFPIADRKVPAMGEKYVQLVRNVTERLREGAKVVVHCRMGIGRTGMVAAGVLIRGGMSTEEAFAQLSQVRMLKVPDTEQQVRWVEQQRDALRRA